MLSKRSLYLLVAVVIVLALISFLQRQSHRRSTGQASSEIVIDGVYGAEDLQRITVGYGADPQALVLERQPDGWTVATAWHAPANEQRITTLLENLSGLRGEFRSDDPSVLADYGFTDSTTVVISAETSGGQPAFGIEIGEKAGGTAGEFVKRPGDTAVYLTGRSVLSNLGLYGGPQRPAAKHFIDLQAYKVDRNEIEAITLRNGDRTIALRKEFPAPEPPDSTGFVPPQDRAVYEWKLLEPVRKAAAKTKADGVQNALVSLRAVDVVDPGVERAAYGLADPDQLAMITLQDSSTVIIAFGSEHEPQQEGQPGGRYVTVADDPTVWLVSDYVVKNVFKDYQELLPEE